MDSERVEFHNMITKAHKYANNKINERAFYYGSIHLGGLYEEMVELTEQQTQSSLPYMLILPYNRDFFRLLSHELFFVLHTHPESSQSLYFKVGAGTKGFPPSGTDLMAILTMEEMLKKNMKSKDIPVIFHGAVDSKALWMYDFSDSSLGRNLRRDMRKFEKSLGNLVKELDDKPKALEYYKGHLEKNSPMIITSSIAERYKL